MSTTDPFTLDDLRRILREGSGTDEGTDIDVDIAQTEFKALGYDSLALLETYSRIEREREVSLDEDAMADVRTPGALVDIVNAHLAAHEAPDPKLPGRREPA
ncbi:acyl carrier protein [Streptomyces mirabilis]|uniref:acyl carrier protein n=1 Tax=Streptomyces mirabilis TaxID=68239 RepID=UPI0022589EBB|nr:acyl carrier protein [Streptomyces mirabilis]MCX4428517.1 acyl carrier protein [Streptomyces mirabilis]